MSDLRALLPLGRQSKIWNLNTPKFHSLGDVSSYIKMFGTTDSYSTQLVRLNLSVSTGLADSYLYDSQSTSIVSPSQDTGERTREGLPIKYPASRRVRRAFGNFGNTLHHHRTKDPLMPMVSPHSLTLSASRRINLCNFRVSRSSIPEISQSR